MSHRPARPVAAAVVITLVLQAPATGMLALSAPSAPSAAHILNRLGYGPRPGDIARIQRIGVEAWIEQQLHPERIDDRMLEARLAAFETLTLDSETIVREYHEPAIRARRARQLAQSGPPQPSPDVQGQRGDGRPAASPSPAAPVPSASPASSAASVPSAASASDRVILVELEQAKLLRAIYSERQLQEVLVDFWFNHFNVFAGKGPTRAYITSFERDVIRPHVLGSFRQMLEAVASSPAMLFYLDNWMNTSPEAPRADRTLRQGQRRPGPTRAPGRAEAGALRAQRQAEGRSPTRGINENYARELLELHTLGVDGGYTQDDIVNVARAFTGWTFRPRQGTAFHFSPARHDDGEKRVLGQRIAGGGGIEDGRRVLDLLVAHPSTARFIATKLAQRFVADEPPQALVDRAARRFAETRGDLGEVTRAVITSPEFLAADAGRSKVKTPLEFVASAIRATGAEVRSALPLARALRDLGMPLYFCQPPTGYDEVADPWVSSGALVARMNFALELGANRLRGVSIGDGDVTALRERIVQDVLAGHISTTTRAALDRAATADQAVALAIGSPEFQRQ